MKKLASIVKKSRRSTIPIGWRVIREGKAERGDRFWSDFLAEWSPIGEEFVGDYLSNWRLLIIRKDKSVQRILPNKLIIKR